MKISARHHNKLIEAAEIYADEKEADWVVQEIASEKCDELSGFGPDIRYDMKREIRKILNRMIAFVQNGKKITKISVV